MALLVVSILTVSAPLDALEGNVKVIANSSVKADEISTIELKRVFLLETNSLPDGTHAEPVLMKSGPAHQAFLNDLLNVRDEALQTYYRTLVFTGRASMPK